MAETKKSAEPAVAPPAVEPPPEQIGAPLPPSGDETPLPVAPPVVKTTKGENGTVTNQIGGGK